MENAGLLGFDIGLYLIALLLAILIPIGIKVISVLNQILTNSKSVKGILETLTKISEELVEARLRDNDLRNEVNNLKEAFRNHLGKDKGITS